MPDVTVDNPKVQIDLEQGESTTVPSGQRFHVTLITDEDSGELSLNGNFILDGTSGDKKSTLEVDLFGGDTITSETDISNIRGYRVD